MGSIQDYSTTMLASSHEIPRETADILSNKRVVAVYMGSSPGNGDLYLAAARELAQVFHDNDIILVYGGGSSGIMGELSRTLVSLSGPDSVYGIIPKFLLDTERGDVLPAVEQYGRTIVVPDMHTRKDKMAKLVKCGAAGSGFIGLTGGFGTLEEVMEVSTWNQLNLLQHGVVLFNVAGYWDGLIEWANNAVTAGFVKEGARSILESGETAAECVRILEDYVPNANRSKIAKRQDLSKN